ncbi:conserved oligomeric Golgi complex subunit 2-like [Limulus polyphemus]|uniref:Conserved oligomeric Golgi complex subunit 2 n=1 Tax=Limulus polyphemus TaxID=6850 RepID=A0ABM1BW15_LIMPO|nr:conserved oligomeric Golgi complex subunit 2-like [Limulus polyphemus]
MSLKNIQDILPHGSSSLCFRKEEFIKENFSVDQFVSEHRKHVSLETLRDDLGIYLRVLRSAMIELINKDYADFVNLSTNLVGLDKSIQNLTVPLGQFKEEVLTIKHAVDEALSATTSELKKIESIREKKMMLQRVAAILHGFQKLEELLEISSCSPELPAKEKGRREWSGKLVERAAVELNQILFYLSKCNRIPVIEDIRHRINHIATVLMEHLDHKFLDDIHKSNTESLQRILRIYATIDRISETELLFQRNVVKPYMQEVITEKQVEIQGITKMYEKVLQFVPSKCKDILEVTREGRSGEVVKGYDFLVNAIWPEIITCLETRVHFIFQAGDPNKFHERYSSSMTFLEKFEQMCGSQASIKRLHQHKSYHTFIGKWNLPVYFQVRFQEIAKVLETAILTPFTKTEAKSVFNLYVTCQLWNTVQRCWASDVYLAVLCHRFWKLTLQLISRYNTWACQLIQTEHSTAIEELKLSDENLKIGPSSSTGDARNGRNLMNGPNSGSTDSRRLEVSKLVLLVTDIVHVQNEVPLLFDNVILPHLQHHRLLNVTKLQETIKETTEQLKELPPKIGELVVNDIVFQCLQHLRMVSEIPRLYRKTNRDVPTKPSTYVQMVLRPLETFQNDNKDILTSSWLTEWTKAILDKLTTKYFKLTSDVLDTLRKMDKSLKQLKRIRDKGAGESRNNSSGVSDDDKIHLQLWLDVENFGQQIEILGVKKSTVQEFESLVELVKSTRSSPTTYS